MSFISTVGQSLPSNHSALHRVLVPGLMFPTSSPFCARFLQNLQGILLFFTPLYSFQLFSVLFCWVSLVYLVYLFIFAMVAEVQLKITEEKRYGK